MAAYTRSAANTISDVAGAQTAKEAVQKNSDALDALITEYNVVEAQVTSNTTSMSGLTAGSGVAVSSNDTNVGYLNGKMLAGEGIDFTVGNEGADETLTVSAETATVTNPGIVELATSAETITGSDTGRGVVPSGLTEALRAKFLL